MHHKPNTLTNTCYLNTCRKNYIGFVKKKKKKFWFNIYPYKVETRTSQIHQKPTQVRQGRTLMVRKQTWVMDIKVIL